MQAVAELRSDALRELFWRDEIPEAIYWLEGEGHGPGVDTEVLQRVLPAEPAFGPQYLDRLVESGLLRRSATGRYELTGAGWSHGARLFADDFDEFGKSAALGACACGCCGEEPEPDRPVPAASSGCACGCCQDGSPSEDESAAAGAVSACGCGRA